MLEPLKLAAETTCSMALDVSLQAGMLGTAELDDMYPEPGHMQLLPKSS